MVQTTRIRVLTRPTPMPTGTQGAVLGEQIRVDTALLDEFSFASGSAMSNDLLALAGGVAFADRAVRRRHNDGWSRNLALEMPVYELEQWRRPEVVASLLACLQYLTGDHWSIAFRKRYGSPALPRTGHLVGPPPLTFAFMPYSGGLDSYAQARLIAHQEPGLQLVPVFTDPTTSAPTWKAYCQRMGRESVRPIGVPTRIEKIHHPEPTFRSRPFLFFVIAGLAALAHGADRVIIPENGQGSLVGSLAPVGHEACHRSCYPGFTQRLAAFLVALTGQALRFEHPALFNTKSEVLSSLSRLNLDHDWLSACRSCSYDSRMAHVGGEQVHCGVCGNCLLRRVSLNAAGVADTTAYLFDDLSATTLPGGAKATVRGIKAYQDVAYNSVRSMSRLASMAHGPDAVRWRVATDLARYGCGEPEEVDHHLAAMLGRHDREWRDFCAQYGADAWINTGAGQALQ